MDVPVQKRIDLKLSRILHWRNKHTSSASRRSYPHDKVSDGNSQLHVLLGSRERAQ